MPIAVPRVYRGFHDAWEHHEADYIASYGNGDTSFVPNLLPETAIGLSADAVVTILKGRLGDRVDLALARENTDPEVPAADLPAEIASPVAGWDNGHWLKTSNMVGINVRTVQTFWSVVKYLLTVPDAIDSVHLLPIWEPGVVDSLYGMASWRLNSEFYDAELAAVVPHLDSAEAQLRAVINLIHATGRTVGMDVIPHTDRYSEMSMAQPHFFEWLQRQDVRIVDHSENLHLEVEREIMRWLEEVGPATLDAKYPTDPAEFFGEGYEEVDRLRILFGSPSDRIGRHSRRGDLVAHLASYGLEPVPATMGTPFRGVEADTRNQGLVVDDDGNTWRDYVIAKAGPFSRVFNPLSRYKLYGRKDNNRHWEIDFDRPRPEVFSYVAGHYAEVQARFGFDFMRGDMSHVQMRPTGVPGRLDQYYDILGAIKNQIREGNGVPFFGYFAETFLPPRDVFGFGEEVDHLEAADADVTQGDLQSNAIGSPEFMVQLRQYLDIASTRAVVPAFTVITPDKDDPRFDDLYQRGNVVRAFIGLFLTDVPSYVSLGHEIRDVHLTPWPNEHYTKLFVFHEHGEDNVYPSKARRGARYLWGKNGSLFGAMTRLRLFADSIYPAIRSRPIRWLLPPDPRAYRSEIAWTQWADPDYVFVANLNTDEPVGYFAIPTIPDTPPGTTLELTFSTENDISDENRQPPWNGKHFRIESLEPEEARVYRIVRPE
ncbi:MAG: hypothetical protein HKO82_12975 [Acidimicrobiia bacterium]|nr:hypothetical protein [Acidimicrobiia bacterium]NNF87412.1 hypothetical protein [Acidimicrobiia bacterium]NNL14585.1 hypothetical protein [Acidimicrobiia bacterium]